MTDGGGQTRHSWGTTAEDLGLAGSYAVTAHLRRRAHHMVAGDQNDAFAAAVVDFLTRVSTKT
jgi:hypothetical protein